MIEKLHLKNFTCFADNEFEFSEGINVFIGENGTGKTHLLKAIITLLHGAERKLTDVNFKDKGFTPHGTRLFFGKSKSNPELRNNEEVCEAVLFFNADTAGYQIFYEEDLQVTKIYPKYSSSDYIVPKYLFIPSKEMLSFFPGFTAMYEKRETSFDETYNLLAKALELPLLKKDYAEKLGLPSFVSELEEIIGGQVINENGRFYIKTGDNKTEINLVAEGWRKIATLIYLILNGELELNKNMVLLIDEPEANLNPKLISVMAKFLVKLANKGVQVFVATHSYLLANYLSLYNEYKDVQNKEEEIPDIKFFGLSKNVEGIEVETSDSFTGLSSNAILDEYAAFLDLENQFIRQQMKVK